MPTYTQNWFHHETSFDTLKNEFKDLKPLNFLEICSFEGKGTNYFCENFLSNLNDTITCVDPWIDNKAAPQTNFAPQYDYMYYTSLYETFIKNISQYKNKVIIKRGFSTDVVPLLEDNYYDLIFIDGDHSEKIVYLDAVNSFEKLKKNGFTIFDDYYWSKIMAKDEFWGTDLAIDRFISEYKDKVEIIFTPECSVYKGKKISSHQVGLKKI